MSTNRLKAAQVIDKLKVATMDDLADCIPVWNRKKIIDTVKDLCQVGIASRIRDDVTGLPAYVITNMGSKWLADQNPIKKTQSVTPAGSGDVTPADKHRTTIVDGGSKRAEPPAEGLSVIEQATPDKTPAAPCSDEIKALANAIAEIRQALCIEHEPSIDIVHTIHELIDNNNEWRKAADALDAKLTSLGRTVVDFCEWLAHRTGERCPMNLHECKSIINALLAENSKKQPSTAKDHTGDTTDMVNHPPHYQGKVECIDAIESALGPEGFAAYCRGNAIKYTFRAGKKGAAHQDLAKAAWYLNRVQS